MKVFRLIVAISILLWGFATPILAQVMEPTVMTINQVEVYEHARELNDQLYLITYNLNYTTTPVLKASDTYIARLMNGAAELGRTTPYAYFNNGYDLGIMSLYFSAATAPVWGGGYTVRLEGNPTLHWMDTVAVTAMTAAVADDGGALTDQTAASNSAAANDMTLMPAGPAVNDAYYFGSSGQFNILTVNVSTNGTWGGTYTWEYWDGDAWVVPAGLVDGSNGFTAGTGNRNITYTAPTNWQQTTVNGVLAFWLRFRIVTYISITTQPLGAQSWTNTLASPPYITSPISPWIVTSTVTETQERLTIRVGSLAAMLENDWGGTTDLVETVAGIKKLTQDGEAYFEGVIANLRAMCPSLFVASISTPDFASSDLVRDFYTGGDDSQRLNYGVNWYAQTFATTSNYKLNGVWIKAFRLGNPGTVTTYLRGTVAGLPDVANLLTGTIDGNTFTTNTDGEWYWVTFTDSYVITIGTTYAIVTQAAAGGVADYAAWRIDTAGVYTGGQATVSAGSGGPGTWAAIANNDFMFTITADNAYSLSYRDRLAQRLIGTRFDMTALGVAWGNMGRMWATGIMYFLVICMPVTITVLRLTQKMQVTPIVLAILFLFGGLTGLLYLEIGILLTVLMAGVAILSLWGAFRGG